MIEIERENKSESSVDDCREKRRKLRFQIEQNVRYKILFGQQIAEVGTGRTTNISSGGVCFITDRLLPVGTPVELSIDWPALLNGSCPMMLTIYGCVVRSDGKGTGLATERYEFRTQRLRPVPLPEIAARLSVRT